MINLFEKRVFLWLGLLGLLVSVLLGVTYEFFVRDPELFKLGALAGVVAVISFGSEIVYLIIKTIRNK